MKHGGIPELETHRPGKSLWLGWMRYYAAACQLDLPNPSDRNAIQPRVDRMLGDDRRTRWSATSRSSTCGWSCSPSSPTPRRSTPRPRSCSTGWPCRSPTSTRTATAQKARQLGVYIQTGTFLESDPRWPGHVFNTTCLIGPGRTLEPVSQGPSLDCLGKSTPARTTSAGYDEPLFPVAETEIGRLGAAICYDWLFPEAIRQLGLAGAEVLVRVSAYMDPWGTAAPMDWWTTINRVRAIENMAYVVAVEPGGEPEELSAVQLARRQHDRRLRRPHAGPGRSRAGGARSWSGRSTWPRLRAERERRRGHHLLAHLRTEAYPAYRQPIYPAGGAEQSPLSLQANEHAACQAQEALDRIQRGKTSGPGE